MYACSLYGKSGADVNDVRYALFWQKEPESSQLPPTKDALSKHTSGANLPGCYLRQEQQNKVNLQNTIIMKLNQERQRMQEANKQLKIQLKETNQKVETTKKRLGATEASVAKLRTDNQKPQQEIEVERNHNKTLSTTDWLKMKR